MVNITIPLPSAPSKRTLVERTRMLEGLYSGGKRKNEIENGFDTWRHIAPFVDDVISGETTFQEIIEEYKAGKLCNGEITQLKRLFGDDISNYPRLMEVGRNHVKMSLGGFIFGPLILMAIFKLKEKIFQKNKKNYEEEISRRKFFSASLYGLTGLGCAALSGLGSVSIDIKQSRLEQNAKYLDNIVQEYGLIPAPISLHNPGGLS